MADNYLENKMDEYRRGPQRRAALSSPTRQKAGTAVLPFEPCFAAIYSQSAIPEAVEKAAIALRATGSRVALVSTDEAYARGFAQRHSLIYVPGSELPESMGNAEIALHILADRSAMECLIYGRQYMLPITAALADRIIYLALPLTRQWLP